VQGAPSDKGPVGAVPEAAQNHGDHEVGVSAGFCAAGAAEGDEQVVAQPGGEGDVPAMPEIRRVGGAVGGVKVAGEAVAEEEGAADGDVGVAGKVAVDLGGVAVDGEQGVGAGIGFWVGEDGLDQHGGQDVGQNDFFEEAGDDEEAAGIGANGEGVARDGELREEIAGAQDGAGDELGEEGDVEQRVPQVDFLRQFAAIGIHQQRNRVKNKERDAQRQQRGRKIDTGEGAEIRPDIEAGEQQKTGILEVGERGEAEDDAGGEPASLVRRNLDFLRDERGDEGNADEQGQKMPVPERIERVGGEQQKILVPGRLRGQQPGDDQDRHEKQRVFDGRKQHGCANRPP